MKKFLKVFFSVLGILVLVIIIAWTALDISKYILYSDYYDGYARACAIPDIHSGFTPRALPTSPPPMPISSPAMTASTSRSTMSRATITASSCRWISPARSERATAAA